MSLAGAGIRMTVRLLTVTALAVGAAACGAADPEPLVVGADRSAESRVLAEIYAQALARTGVAVEVRDDYRTRGDLLTAMGSGEIAVFGDRTGALLAALDDHADAQSTAEVGAALNGSLPQDAVVSDPADSTDLRPAILLTATTAEQQGLDEVADLPAKCPTLTAGVAPAPGLLELPAPATAIPRCAFAATHVFGSPAELQKALADNRIQIGILGGPVESLPGGAPGLTTLPDTADAPDKALLRAQHVLAVVRKGVLDAQQSKKLDYVAGELTTDELLTLIQRVRDESVTPSDPVRDWLDTHGL